MRIKAIAAIIPFLVLSGFAQAQPSELCEALDLADAAKIKACLEDDPWYEARTKPIFEPNKECPKLQLQIAKKVMETIDPKVSRSMNSGTIEDGRTPVPSCKTASEVVELIRGRPSSWTACLDYDAAGDKFQHFKTCITSYTIARHGIVDEKQTASHLAGLDCKHAVFKYREALALIHTKLKSEGPDYGKRLPKSYQDPDCQQVVAFLQGKGDEAEQERAERVAQAEAQKAEQRRLAEEQASKAALRAQKTAEMNQKIEEGYQLAYQDMNEEILQARINSAQTRDKIGNEDLLFALAKQIWAQVPEDEHESGTIKAKLFHTSHGFRTWMNLPTVPEIVHGIRSVDIASCAIAGDRAQCAYTVVVSTQVTYNDNSNQARADLYSKFATALVGPRRYSWKSDLHHDGKQWDIELTDKQKKDILPPEVDMNSSHSGNEKTQCDLMSAMGIPMLC